MATGSSVSLGMNSEHSIASTRRLFLYVESAIKPSAD